MERVAALVGSKVDMIALDTAHGQSRGVLDMVSRIKAEYPHLPVMAGNVPPRRARKTWRAPGRM